MIIANRKAIHRKVRTSTSMAEHVDLCIGDHIVDSYSSYSRKAALGVADAWCKGESLDIIERSWFSGRFHK